MQAKAEGKIPDCAEEFVDELLADDFTVDDHIVVVRCNLAVRDLFRGLQLVTEIKAGIGAALRAPGQRGLAALIGTEANAITRQPWPA